MVTLDNAVIAKLDKDGKHFEVLVDPELAYELKSGKIVSISKLLAINEIFKDAKKGLKISEHDLKVFKTDDIEEITKEIIENGDVQLTTNLKRKKIEEKKRQIAEIISRNGINPKTKTVHPIERILNAMEESHTSIDPFKPAETQVESTLKNIKAIIPISFEKIIIDAKIPAQHVSALYKILSKFKKINENWLSDGSWLVEIEIPAGMKEKLYSLISGKTHGEAIIKEKR